MKTKIFKKNNLAIHLIILLLLYLFFSYSVSNNIEITRHDVKIKNLPAKLNGYKIVQISDLHRRKVVPDKIIKDAAELANKEKADIIVLTGDFISNGPTNIEPCAQLIKNLKAKNGIYAVLGNHDHWTDADAVEKALSSKGIIMMQNKNIKLEKNLYLIGVDDIWAGQPDYKKAWKNVPTNSAQVFLCHSPQDVEIVRDKSCLMLTGHTHGGQICLPPIPRNKLPGLKGWKYIEGWYKIGQVQMYVNRGIGVVNPPFRLFCKPEISVFTLYNK